MKRRIIVFGIIVIFLIILSLRGSFIYRDQISGRIIDSVTNQPVPNIKVERTIKLDETKLFAGSDIYKVVRDTAYTNQKGEFQFNKNIISKLPLLTWFDKEWINVNLNGTYRSFSEEGWQVRDNNPENENYYPLGFGFFSVRAVQFNQQIYQLQISPVVNEISKCENNSLCIEDNSFDLALINRDKSFCLNIKEEFQKDMCFSMIAVSENNQTVCNLIESIHQKDLCINYINRKDKNSVCGHDWAKRRKELCLSLFNNY